MHIHQNPRNLVQLVLKRLRLVKASSQGFSLVELAAAIAVIGVLSAIAAPNVQFGNQPLKDTTNRVTSNLKLIRAKAMAQTSAFRITPISATQLLIERAQNCTATGAGWSRDPGFADEDLTFDEDVAVLTATEDGNPAPNDGWSVCYNSRGIADRNLSLTLSDGETQRVIEVFPGGTIES